MDHTSPCNKMALKKLMQLAIERYYPKQSQQLYSYCSNGPKFHVCWIYNMICVSNMTHRQFTFSDVLKFEFLSQLLVDSGCLLLILKILGLQEITNLVAAKTDVEGCR